MLKPKYVRYKVTGPYGKLEEGTIINSILIVDDGIRALLYHPKVRGECGSFDLTENVGDENGDLYVSTDPDRDYVNVDRAGKLEDALFGRNFKYKRVKE